MARVSRARLPTRPPRGRKELTVVVTTRARRPREVAKWITTRWELSLESTTSLPRKACTPMTINAPNAGQNSEATDRYLTQAKMARATTSITTRDADRRCEYSTIEWKSNGGGHPPPEPGHAGRPRGRPPGPPVPPTPPRAAPPPGGPRR